MQRRCTCSFKSSQILPKKKLLTLLGNGIPLQFNGFPEHLTIPQSNIPLNGEHIITIGRKNLFAADAKAAFALQGCDSANQRFLPFFQIPTEALCNPDLPLSYKRFVPLNMRKEKYRAVNEFRNCQREKFIEQAQTVQKEAKKGEDVSKKIHALFKKFMKKDVCDRAAEIETGCVNQSPLDVAEICVTCGLHMDCNEFLRALEHIIKQCALLSLHLYPDKTFVLQSGNSSSARGGRNNAVVPDISILPEASPLIQATRVLEDGRLPKLAAFFRKRFTPGPDESSRVEQYLDLDGCGEDLFDLLEDLFDLQCGESQQTTKQAETHVSD